MKALLDMLWIVIHFPISYVFAVLTFTLPLERKRNFSLRLVLILAAVLGVLVGYCMIGVENFNSFYVTDENIGFYYGLGSLLFCTMLVVMMVLTVLFVWRVSFREGLYCAMCAYLTEHLSYCVRTILGAVFPQLQDLGLVFFYLTMGAVYLGVYFFYVRRMVRNQHYDTSAMNSVQMTLSVLTVVMVMSIVASNYGFEFVHAVYAMMCCIYLLAMQLKQQEQLNLQEELGLQQQLWLRHKAQYEIARENIDIINRKCHDLKHQVAALKHVQEPTKRAQVIDSLQEAVIIYDSILKTGNEILDTVLTEKSLQCNQNSVKLTCIADGSLLTFMDAVDLYTLFGNAMDNGIEAVLSLPQEERIIDLQVRQKAGLILITISNRFAGALDIREGLPQTRKADDGYHGFGLKSIQMVAEKYGGFLDLNTDGALFTLRITIPIHR